MHEEDMDLFVQKIKDGLPKVNTVILEKTDNFRDLCAIAAMHGMLVDMAVTRHNNRRQIKENWQELMARESYQIADAMVKAREGEE